jgi:hypothetical protein
MRNETRQYNGPALVEWIENECKALGYGTLHDFGNNNGIPPKNFTDWKGGAVPGLGKLQQVAEALGRPLVDVLLAAHVLRPDDIGGRELPRTSTVTPQQAIKASSWIPREDKLFLIKTLDRLEADSDGPLKVESGEPGARRGRKRRAGSADST